MKQPLEPRQKRVGKYIVRLLHTPGENVEAGIVVLAPVTKRWQGRGFLTRRVKIGKTTYWDEGLASYRFYADALREYEGSTSVARLREFFNIQG